MDEQPPNVPAEIAELYIDAVEVMSSPYTVRLIVGKDASGTFTPQLALTLSPHFAAQLEQTLSRVLAHYRNNYGPLEIDQGTGDDE